MTHTLSPYRLIGLLILFVATLAVHRTNAQQISLSHRWAHQAGGIDDDTGRGIALDQVGNTYVTGRFIGTVTFGSTTLRSVANSQDIFLVKYSPSGVVEWATSAGSDNTDSGIAIAIDAANNIYITGYYNGACSFNTQTLAGYGAYDVFLAKYNAAGVLQWARGAGGLGNDEGSGLSITPNGEAAVVGFFDNELHAGSSTPLLATGRHAYLLRYDAQGVPSNPVLVGGPTDSHARGAAFDAVGNTYVTGNTAATNGDNNGFLTKIAPDGSELWTRFVGGSGFDRSIGVAVDDFGGVIIAGLFENSATFDSTIVTSRGDYDGFISKYDINGNLTWVRTFGGTQRDYATNLAIDQYGNPFIIGFFTGSALFEQTSLNSGPSSSRSVFRAWYDWQGNLLGAESPSNSANAIGYGVAVSRLGDTYITGNFDNNINLTPFSFTSNGNNDVFVGCISSNTTLLHPPRALGIIEQITIETIHLYPNPAVAGTILHLPLALKTAAFVQVCNSQGQLVQSGTSSPQNLPTSGSTFSLGQHSAGLYTVFLSTNGRRFTARFAIR
jgi:hypothetical protein